MKIGIFDSGLGGLLILRALARKLPEYDYVYLGDTQRVPYGNRSPAMVAKYLEEAVDFLLRKNCALIVVACNTASSEALRYIQQKYLPKHYPDRRVLGVIIPSVEVALAPTKNGSENPLTRVGVLATAGTVRSATYVAEAQKLDPQVKVFQSAAPLLVPLIENDGRRWAEPILEEYLAPLKRKKVQKIILGCTHYPALKREIRELSGVPVVSQDEILPAKLMDYLKRHSEIESRLRKQEGRELLVTDVTPAYEKLARSWFGKAARLRKVALRQAVSR
ncbi:MAG TPA: glutamate racemase [Terriglobales bacterium]|nr:glutamate racemase [Terriglobales bacterium]